MTLFRIDKISRGWSFWSVTRTSLLSCSCFFFPLVEVGLVVLAVLLATLLVGGNAEEEGGGEKEEVVVEEEGVGAKVEEERPFFSFSAYVFGATSSRRAFTSSTSPFRISVFCLSFSFIEGFSPTRIFCTSSLICLTCSLLSPSSLIQA